MTPFVDPRSDPDPSAPKPPPRTTDDPDDLAELHRLCREDRPYDVERWIAAGKPPQMVEHAPGEPVSALEIALADGKHALTLLLLCNGYDPHAEPDCPLDQALGSRRWDVLDMFLDWGTNPDAILDTYRSDVDVLLPGHDSPLRNRPPHSPTPALKTGARSSAMTSWPPRSSTGCFTTATSSRSAATATACAITPISSPSSPPPPSGMRLNRDGGDTVGRCRRPEARHPARSGTFSIATSGTFPAAIDRRSR